MNWWSLRQKIHMSWAISIICSGFIIGIFISRYLNITDIDLSLVFIVSLALIFVAISLRYQYLIPTLILGGTLLGIYRGSIIAGELSNYEPLYGSYVNVNGVNKDDIDTDSSNQIVIRLENLKINGKSFPGLIWVTTDYVDIKRGDELTIYGKLDKGFGNFSGVIYRANVKKIVNVQGDFALSIRDKFSNAVRSVISEPESSLGIGYLVGQKRSLPVDLVLSLQIAGLTHIVVASGYNLTILVRLTRRLFARFSKYLSVLSASLMVIFFVSITGMSPSMLRAGLVSFLSLATWYYGRRFHPLALLIITASITLMINPSFAWGDLGWQLSFVAFSGVMIIAPLLQRYLFGDEKPKFYIQILIETISAQIATAPLLIMTFSQLSNVAVFSNLLVLPLVPLAMLLTFIAGVSNLIIPTISNILALPAYFILHYMVKVSDFFADLPWALSNINFGISGLIVCYVLIIFLVFCMSKITKYKLRDVNIVE